MQTFLLTYLYHWQILFVASSKRVGVVGLEPPHDMTRSRLFEYRHYRTKGLLGHTNLRWINPRIYNCYNLCHLVYI